jgi:hypothetical protein
MSDSNLDRVQEDLAVMRQAMGLRPAIEWEHVWVCLALAVVGIATAALTAFTNVAALPMTHGSGAHLTYIALLVAPPLMVFGGMAVLAWRRRALAPLLWRESRQSAVIAFVATSLYLVFLAWAVWNGVSPGALTVATLFLVGLFALLGGLSEPNRRHHLGWAIATMLAGACAPLGSYGSAGLIVGGWLILGSLSTAGIIYWQLRNRSTPNGQRR